MTTLALPRSSSAVNSRPMAGAMPSAGKSPLVAAPTCTVAASPLPVRAMVRGSIDSMAANDVSALRKLISSICDSAKSSSPPIGRHLRGTERHEPIGIGEGERTQERRVDDAEHRRRRGNSERERDGRGEGVQPESGEGPDRKTKVVPHVLQTPCEMAPFLR